MQYLWSLYDRKSKSYIGVLPTSDFVDGLRSGDGIFTDEKYDYRKYTLDYRFVYLGNFDDNIGVLFAAERNIHYSHLEIAGLLNIDDIERFDPLSSYYDATAAFPTNVSTSLACPSNAGDV